MAKAETLLKKVCDNPNDLKARAAYAKEMVKANEPRGKFVEQQLELSDASGLEEWYPELLANTMRLLSEHGGAWLEPLLKMAPVDPDDYTRMEHLPLQNAVFDCGFVRRLAACPEDAAKHWDAMTAIEPLVGLELVVYEEVDDGLGATDFPQRCQSLKVTPNGWLMAHSLGTPLNWGLEALEELDFSGCDLGLDGAMVLANEPTTLGDTFDDWTDPPPINHEQLTTLVLKNTNILDEGLQLLLSKRGLHSLKQLDVGQCKLNDEDSAAALLPLTALEDLSIAGNNGLPLKPLMGWSQMAELRRVSLPQTIEPSELQQLFPQPSENLRVLEIASAKSAAADAATLGGVAKWLLELNLSMTRIGDKGFLELLDADSMRTLVKLKANGCSLSDKAVDALTQVADSRLVSLDLSSNKLSDKALQSLAEWEGLAGIAYLRTDNNRKLSKAGYEALVEAAQFQPATLEIGACKDEDAVEMLRDRFGAALKTK